MGMIYGQLQVAQFENLSSDPASALAVGRMWINIATATRGVPKFYDGNAVRNLDFTNLNAIGNSSTTLTIDWSLGTTQSVTLTGNCVVTHSNLPTNGRICTLIVTQATANPLYKLTFPTDNYWQKQVIPQVLPANSVRKYQFMSVSGFLPAITSLTNYSVLNVNTVTSCSQAQFSPDGNFLAISNAGSALWVVGCAPGAFNLNFGAVTPYQTTSGANSLNPIAWHPSGMYVAVGTNSSPYVQVFPVSNGVIGAQLTNPGTLPTAAVTALAWSPAGDALVYCTGTSPFVGGWPFSYGAFGTAYSNPGTAAQAASAIKFHPSGLFIALGYNASPGLGAYAFTAAGGFGTKSASPSPTILISQVPEAIAFSPDGLYIAAASTATPYIHVWPFSAGGAFGTVVTNPGTLPAGQCYGLAFSPSNDYLFATCQTGSTVLYSYPWTPGAFGTLGSNPTTLPPTSSLFGVTVHPSGEYVAWYGNSTPFVGVYNAPKVVKNVIANQLC